jgi:hypothetical protein
MIVFLVQGALFVLGRRLMERGFFAGVEEKACG